MQLLVEFYDPEQSSGLKLTHTDVGDFHFVNFKMPHLVQNKDSAYLSIANFCFLIYADSLDEYHIYGPQLYSVEMSPEEIFMDLLERLSILEYFEATSAAMTQYEQLLTANGIFGVHFKNPRVDPTQLAACWFDIGGRLLEFEFSPDRTEPNFTISDDVRNRASSLLRLNKAFRTKYRPLRLVWTSGGFVATLHNSEGEEGFFRIQFQSENGTRRLTPEEVVAVSEDTLQVTGLPAKAFTTPSPDSMYFLINPEQNIQFFEQSSLSVKCKTSTVYVLEKAFTREINTKTLSKVIL